MALSPRTRGAGRYSQFVAWAKILLPIVALALLASVFLLRPSQELPGGLTFSSADLDALEDGLRVTNPQLSGATRNGDLFSLTADWALPDSAEISAVTLSNMQGRFDYANGQSVTLSAPRGDADLMQRTVRLSEGIRITTSDGYSGTTDAVTADLDLGTLEAPGPVTLTGPAGEIEGGALSVVPGAPAGDTEATQENQVFRFTKGVKLVFRPAKAPGDPAQ